MAQGKYEVDVEDYLRLTERYDVRFEYIDGQMSLRDGTPVILLGSVVTEGPASRNAFVVIANATKEEIEQLAGFVASMRKNKNEV